MSLYLIWFYFNQPSLGCTASLYDKLLKTFKLNWRLPRTTYFSSCQFNSTFPSFHFPKLLFRLRRRWRWKIRKTFKRKFFEIEEEEQTIYSSAISYTKQFGEKENKKDCLIVQQMSWFSNTNTSSWHKSVQISTIQSCLLKNSLKHNHETYKNGWQLADA